MSATDKSSDSEALSGISVENGYERETIVMYTYIGTMAERIKKRQKESALGKINKIELELLD